MRKPGQNNYLPPGVFTPCAAGGSLLKPLPAAVKIAAGNRFLFSDFDQFRDNPHLEEVYLPNDNLICPGIFRGKFRSKE